METYIEEKIGNPELFTGRKKEMQHFLQWIDKIKEKHSKSSAILSRRKTGKSAIMQRLYNITFEKNDQVVPFYYEIKESSQWILDFSIDFFLNFIYQYIAFKSRKKEYINNRNKTLSNASTISEKEGLLYLLDSIKAVSEYVKERRIDMLWNTVRDTPRLLAQYTDERIVQMIDEFQYINCYICRDKACKNRIDNLAGSYLHTIEYKIAPLLLSGSWVGWLIKDINSMLPGRVKLKELEDMPLEESIEMILKYSHSFNEPITEETALILARLTEGNPFYISEIFDSDYEGRDFTTQEGIIKTLEYETTSKKGNIFNTWMEYIDYALKEINDLNGKKIVLYLSKHRDREVGRQELLEKLNLDITDAQLEKRLHALAYSDIIENGRSNFYYKGVQDNIFDKVFRSRYADDIEKFDPANVTNEYKKMYEDIKKKNFSIQGELNYYKGKFAEFMIANKLRYKVYNEQDHFKSMIENLPLDFKFEQYKSVWYYRAAPIYKSNIEIDIFAKADQGISLICEVKNREERRFSKKEAVEFQNRAEEIIKLEKVGKRVLIVFSMAGFTEDAVDYMKNNSIAYTKDQRWVK